MYIALPNQRTEKLTSAIERPYSHHHLNISTTAWGHDCLYPMHSGELITRLLRAEELLPRKGGGAQTGTPNRERYGERRLYEKSQAGWI